MFAVAALAPPPDANKLRFASHHPHLKWYQAMDTMDTTNRFRLFIALELDPTLKAAVQTVQESLQQTRVVRWTRPEQWHLTLQFLGETPVSQVEPLITVLQDVVSGHTPFELALGGVGAFPNLRRPRVIWAGLRSDMTALQVLQQAVLAATAGLGFTAESKPFRPHVTLGRIRREATPNQQAQLSRLIQSADQKTLGHMRVHQVGLIRSQLQRSGPVYTTLAGFELRG